MVLRAGTWPAALPPRRVDFSMLNHSKSGGASLLGSEQIVVSPSGMWKATVTVAVRGESSNLAARAFVAQMEGRAGTMLVPKFDKYRPRNVNGRQLSQINAAGYDESPQDGFNFDLSGLGQEEPTHATLASSAVLGATQVSMNLLDGEGPRPGHYFGIADRLYRCQQVWQVGEGDATTVQFWPRLRAAAADEARVILDRPVCLMRFASDDEGEIALSRAGSGTVSFDFVEAI